MRHERNRLTDNNRDILTYAPFATRLLCEMSDNHQFPIGPRSTTGTLFDELREAIIEGDLAAGTRLGEVELARRHGVARSTVREAIADLVSRGLAERRPNAGARVCQPSRRELRELYELREALEGMACRLAAQNMSDAAIAGVRQLLAEYEQTPGLREGTAYIQGEHDLDFHWRLADGSGNGILQNQLSRTLYDKLRIYRRQFGMVGPRAWPAHQEHQQIVAAIADRDPEMAEMLMRRHIRASLANIERRMVEPAQAEGSVA